jgi:putative acetyltransferase
LRIRPESAGDAAAIYEVNERGFARPNEAELVDLLRAGTARIPELSLVAESNSRIVGHCLFSRASIEISLDDHGILALGPIVVIPEYQRRGIGSALIEHGLQAARALGFRGVILIGHPGYYPRFGFRPAADFGLTCEFEVPGDVFMTLPLVPEGFTGINGRILFAPPFREVD